MKYIDELINRRRKLVCVKKDIVKAFESIVECYKSDNKVLIAGNGGSAADSAHIVGELMKGFKKERKIDAEILKNLNNVLSDYYEKEYKDNQKKLCAGTIDKQHELMNVVDIEIFTKNKLAEMNSILENGLSTIDLTAFTALNTAFANDKNSAYIYANSILGLGKKGDVFIGISTSGNSQNIVNAAIVAKAVGLKVIILSGRDGGKLKNISDVNIIVPEQETYLIQEEHIAIYHALCLDIEDKFY